MRVHGSSTRLITGFLFTYLLFDVGLSTAELIDRGNGLIYDTGLNITWLQDANLAATTTFGVSGIDIGGTMNWNTAQSWIAAMNAANYLGFSDWRFPTTPGTTFGYTSEGEMGYLYYTELGNVEGDGVSSGGLSNPGPFQNLARWYYWYGTEYAPDPGPVFDFRFNDGYQGASYRTLHHLYVWPVRSGDVVLDTDRDGVPDTVDQCPNSIRTPKVTISGCDSGVPNELFNSGCTISDLIAQTATSSRNHGQFLSALASITTTLNKSGVISGSQKAAIQGCAAKARIP